ncbi:hypothetical protein G7Y89_g15755 [Cudoniella acicularis]|uniref:Uncharacterized protein n=1 Tax=Cudoniella acicularis TaxID=354080 RepID=A0A8H4VJN9_9HELO|nr:hypothetical protein G7Y89_g15755 [Cudoniella acicularis]
MARTSVKRVPSLPTAPCSLGTRHAGRVRRPPVHGQADESTLLNLAGVCFGMIRQHTNIHVGPLPLSERTPYHHVYHPSTCTQPVEIYLGILSWVMATARTFVGSPLVSRAKDVHEMFISGSLTLVNPLPAPTLRSAAQNAWLSLRFDVPELEVSAVSGQDNRAYMHYQTPKTSDEANAWPERTAMFEHGKESLDSESLRENILLKKGENNDPAFLLVYSKLTGDEVVTDFHVMLNLDHQITDGIGARILLGKYLSLLVSSLLKTRVFSSDDWKHSGENLSPPWISILNQDQVTSGPEYGETVAWNKKVLLERMKTNPGLPLLPNPKTPSVQKTKHITLSSSTTTLLLQRIKTDISPTSNITHFAHASLVLALLRSQPPSTYTTVPETFYSSCWLNGRRYLNHQRLEKNYVPICMSFSPIIFHDLQNLVLEKNAGKEEVKRKLVESTRIASGGYEKLKARKSVLPEFVALAEDLGRKMLL